MRCRLKKYQFCSIICLLVICFPVTLMANSTKLTSERVTDLLWEGLFFLIGFLIAGAIGTNLLKYLLNKEELLVIWFFIGAIGCPIIIVIALIKFVFTTKG